MSGGCRFSPLEGANSARVYPLAEFEGLKAKKKRGKEG